MKNSPDHDSFHNLEKRLEAYTEQPDALVWENIDAALRPNRTPAWLPWVDHVTSGVTVLLFALLFVSIDTKMNTHNYPTVARADIPSKDKNDSGLNDKSARLLEPSKGVENKTALKNIFNELYSGKNSLAANGKRSSIESINRIMIVSKIEPAMDSALVQDDTLKQPHSFMQESISDSLTQLSDSLLPDSTTQTVKDSKKNKRIPKRRHTVYAAVSPMLSFQRAFPAGSDGVVVTGFSHRSILSAERLGFSFDLGVQGYASKRVEYYSGLSLYHQRQTLRYTYQANNAEVESSGDLNYIVTPTSSERTVQYDMVNLGVQAGLLYHLSGKTLSHKFGLGLLFQRGFQNNKSETYTNAGSSYFSYQLFYRNELRVSSRVRLFIQPSFSHSIVVREKLTAPFNLKPYGAGVGFGVLYDF